MPDNNPNPESAEPVVPAPADSVPPLPGAVAVADTTVEMPADVPAEVAAEMPAEVPAEAQVEHAEVPAAPAAPREGAIADLSPAACAALLAQHFPALFGAGRALPIKLRIQADIQQRVPGVFNKKSLSIFLHRHTTSTAYIKALVNAPHRFDLDGQAAGEIADEHKAAGVVELERRLAIVQAKRQAERDVQRAAHRAARQMPAAAAAGGAVDAAAGVHAEGQPPAGDVPRAPRPDRPPRGDRPPRQDRTAAPHGAPRGERPPRPDRPPRPPRPDRPRNDQRPPMPPRDAAAQPEAAPPAVPLSPEQLAENDARRSRAQLLRAFETTTLTRANFCALKGMKDDALEALLVQARGERGSAPPREVREPRDTRDARPPRDGGPGFGGGPRRPGPSSR